MSHLDKLHLQMKKDCTRHVDAVAHKVLDGFGEGLIDCGAKPHIRTSFDDAPDGKGLQVRAHVTYPAAHDAPEAEEDMSKEVTGAVNRHIAATIEKSGKKPDLDTQGHVIIPSIKHLSDALRHDRSVTPALRA